MSELWPLERNGDNNVSKFYLSETVYGKLIEKNLEIDEYRKRRSGVEMVMARRFVFVREVEELVAKGQTEMELPEGTRCSPAAADMIREMGIRVTFSGGPAPDSGKTPDSEEKSDGSEAMDTASGRGAEEQQSLVAVVSSGQAITDPVGDVAARSPFFLIFDEQGELTEVMENPHRETGGGAGPLVAVLMAERGVSTMVAGRFGTNIKASLEEKGVNYLEYSGQVGEAVKVVLGGR